MEGHIGRQPEIALAAFHAGGLLPLLHGGGIYLMFLRRQTEIRSTIFLVIFLSLLS